eukprot:TRINITY_DN8696_c0_g1_i1.p1 TRINITY_DN8696_c0_g1~~TRINITY_DN8696_c0_g1_i1.p1  ORF type:complete len:173 (-),score=38.04 TRINITY_DN8696_c0_g1_i1:24-542(-)
MSQVVSPVPVEKLEEDIKKWISAKNATLDYHFVESNGSPNINSDKRSVTLSTPDTNITISFSKDISPNDTLATLKASLDYVAINTIPMHGFETPQHWKLSPRTPQSSFSEGVEVIEYGGGRMTVRIKTRFYAVYGNIPALQRGCGPSPKGTYVCVNQDMNATILLELPFSPL